MRTRTIAGVALVVAVLAACGSSSNKTNSTTTTGSSSGSTAPGSESAPAVKTASIGSFGTVLVDANGATLYTLTNNGTAVPCTSSACVAVWPPLLLPSGVTTATGSGVTGLGTQPTSGGTVVTHAGLPLYRFSGDSAPGQAHGDGITSFGGVWHVVKTAAGASTGSGAATTSSSSGGGLGY